MNNKEVAHPNHAGDNHHWEAQPETQREVDYGVWCLHSTVRSGLIIILCYCKRMWPYKLYISVKVTVFYF